jgi:hypothetical protein
MADLPVQPVLNYGQLLSSYGEGLATQQNAATSQLSALAQVPQTQASTALTQAQAQGAGLANQKTAAQIAIMQSLIAPPIVNDQSPTANASGAVPSAGTRGAPGATNSSLKDISSATQSTAAQSTASSVTPDASGASPTPPPAAGNSPGSVNDTSGAGSDALAVSDAGFTPADIAAGMQNKYAVRDQWTPQELQSLHQAQAAEAAGLPNMTANVTAQHNARIQTMTNQAQLGASAVYDQAHAVSSAPPNLALATLKTVHPDTGAIIQKIADEKGWTPEQTDQFVRTYVDEVGNAAHRYSGRDIEVGKDGIARDKQTNQPVLGGVPAGLTPEAHSDLVQKANALTDTYQNGVTTKVPTWQAAGFTSAQQYVNAASKSGGAEPTPTRTITAPFPGAAPNSAPTAAPGAAAPQVADPVLRQALADPTYKYTPPKIPAGQAMDPDSTAKIAATNDARKGILTDAQDATSTASQSLQYLNAAKAIMDNKGANVGAYGGLVAQASRFLPGQSVDATNYQEVAKYLGNAALANAKAVYGQRMTQSEVGLQLNELSPSTKMTPDAITNLINTNARSAQYTIDSAQRTRAYLASGGDPQQFSSWNEKYFPRSAAVNAAPAQSAGAKTVTRTGILNGHKVVQYSDGSVAYAQ